MAYDVGLSLDLRIRRRFIVGAHVGYDAVAHPITVVLNPALNQYATATITDGWVSYGVHGGFLFW